jgi:hypothetical protein
MNEFAQRDNSDRHDLLSEFSKWLFHQCQMMHFHEKQLNDHIAFTDFLLKDAHPSHQAGITNTNDNLDINFAASVQQNPLYYPSDIQQDHWTYQLRIGIARKREVSIKSRHVPALDGITITYDLLYLEQP